MQLSKQSRLALIIGAVVIVCMVVAGAAWGNLESGLVRDAMYFVGGILSGGALGGALAGGPTKQGNTQ